MSNPVVIPIKWSFSSLKTFKNCPKRYFHEKEAADVEPQPPNQYTTYGSMLHEAAEAYIKDRTKLPPEFAYIQGLLDSLLSLPGEKYSELDLSLTSDYTPTNATDPAVWYKGFADIVVLNRAKRRVLIGDFKTGNPRYADMDQLEIYALAAFRHFPDVDEVTGMLLFTKPGSETAPTAVFKRADVELKWLKWHADIDQIRRARELNAWPAKSSGLCGFCPVKFCMEHPSWKF